MSELVLTKLFGIEGGYTVTQTEQTDACLRLHLEVTDDTLVCPACGSRAVHRRGRRHRELQTVPIGLQPVYLVAEVPACHCQDCQARFEVSPPLPPPIAGSPLEWWLSRKPSRA